MDLQITDRCSLVNTRGVRKQGHIVKPRVPHHVIQAI